MSALNTLIEGYYTFTAGDRKLRMRSVIDLQLQADFARWNFQRAVEELSAARQMYTEAEFEAERVKVRNAFRKGEYGFKSQAGIAAMTSMPGLLFVCSRLIEGADEFTVASMLIDGAEDVKELLKQVIVDSFPELKTSSAKKLAETTNGKRPRRRS